MIPTHFYTHCGFSLSGTSASCVVFQLTGASGKLSASIQLVNDTMGNRLKVCKQMMENMVSFDVQIIVIYTYMITNFLLSEKTKLLLSLWPWIYVFFKNRICKPTLNLKHTNKGNCISINLDCSTYLYPDSILQKAMGSSWKSMAWSQINYVEVPVCKMVLLHVDFGIHCLTLCLYACKQDDTILYCKYV